MTPSVAVGVALLLAVFAVRDAAAQIPTACADAESLSNLRCCPTTPEGVCGADANRGACVTLDREGFSTETTDVRLNWPHFYTQVCQCNGNFGGYDCSRCTFGYYGADCSQKQLLPRRPLRDFSEEDWSDFRDVLRLTRTYDPGYVVLQEESIPGNASIATTNVTLYGLYVWIHHYTAKDSQSGKYVHNNYYDMHNYVYP